MNNLIKEIHELGKKIDKVVEEVTDYKTFDELLGLDGEEFEEEIDKVMDRLKELKEQDKEEKIRTGAKKVAEFKAKHNVKEKETGTMFKVYETEREDGDTGVCVEARGEISDVLHFATKGMGEILKAHDFTLDDLDGLTKAFRSTIKRELSREEN